MIRLVGGVHQSHGATGVVSAAFVGNSVKSMAAKIPRPGSLLLAIGQKYRHGFTAAYYRDRVRPRILRTKPVETTESNCEIHALTSAGDWLNLIWALKSFYYHSGRRYGLCIHDDGTLLPEHRETLAYHFPTARMISRELADIEVTSALRDYPRCSRFRNTNLLSRKVFDFAYYLAADRLLLIDSDVLFFSCPEELLRRVEDPEYQVNTVNCDVSSAYTVTPEIVETEIECKLQPKFNSGLGLIHRRSLRLDWIEEFLGLSGIEGHFWRIEQTLYALCSSRFGTELLPDEYTVRLDPGIRECPSRHYVGAIRHLMYSEGIRHLVRGGFLAAV